jgi:hypothetical protein
MPDVKTESMDTGQEVIAFAEKKKRPGCLFYGCLTLIILVLLIAGLSGYGLLRLKDKALSYTDNAPITFDRVALSEERVQAVQEKIAGFSEAVKEDDGAGHLTLSEDEVNALINSYSLFEKHGGGIKVSFENEQIEGVVSLPLKGLPLGFAEGRYLNGSATFNVWCEDGLLIVTMDSLEVKGKEVPDFIMNEIRKTNLAKDLYKDVAQAKMLKRLRRVAVKDGKLVIEVGPVEGRSMKRI